MQKLLRSCLKNQTKKKKKKGKLNEREWILREREKKLVSINISASQLINHINSRLRILETRRCDKKRFQFDVISLSSWHNKITNSMFLFHYAYNVIIFERLILFKLVLECECVCAYCFYTHHTHRSIEILEQRNIGASISGKGKKMP